MKASSVRIDNHKVYKVSAKLEKPIADATHILHEISFLVVRLQLENGIIGESHLLSFQFSPTNLAARVLPKNLPATATTMMRPQTFHR